MSDWRETLEHMARETWGHVAEAINAALKEIDLQTARAREAEARVEMLMQRQDSSTPGELRIHLAEEPESGPTQLELPFD